MSSVIRHSGKLEIMHESLSKEAALKSIPENKVAASLSDAVRIQVRNHAGWYWIGTQSKQVGRGKYTGLPGLEGIYYNNNDGTFTMASVHPDWSESVYISADAAEAAAKPGELLIMVARAHESWTSDSSRISVYSSSDVFNMAKLALVTKPSDKPLGQLVRDAKYGLAKATEQIKPGGAIDNALGPVKELIRTLE